MLAKISVLVVNLNNLEYTKQCIEDLLNQDVEFSLRLIDQNSSEEGTSTYFNSLYVKYNKGDFNGKINFLEIIYSEFNCPLNNLWNYFVSTSSTKFLCLLNNDVRLSPNFLSTSIAVLEKEPLVGFVNHVTNNVNYSQWSDTLEYKIMEQPYRQGWDITFRKSCYSQIPKDLTFFYGDDYIYSKLYSSNYKGAYIFNSPIIHFESKTTVEKGGSRDAIPDSEVFELLELEHKNLTFNQELSKLTPEFTKIRLNIKTLPSKNYRMKEIKSFDVFDTLLARTVENPTHIFDIVEKQFPYNNFKNIRIQAQNQSNDTMDSIYDEINLDNESWNSL
jgi:hypothetical protein